MGNKVVDIRKRDFKKESETLFSYYPGSNILMYEIPMRPIDNCNYTFPRKSIINFLRKNSGLCSIVSEDSLNGNAGSAAMIDYINSEELHGSLDGIFMGGSVGAVRSRIRLMEDVSVQLAKDIIKQKGKVKIYEGGCGFIRIPLKIFKSLEEDLGDVEMSYFGVDKNAEVVKTASEIALFEELSDEIKVYKGDALEELYSLGDFDLGILEGSMEYWNDKYRRDFFEEICEHLTDDGYFITTATHNVPKKKIAKFLGLYFPPMSEEDFINMYVSTGFDEPELIKTNPPNISIGIGRYNSKPS